MDEEQFEAIIVNPEMCEEEMPNSNVGVMELGKRLLLAAKEGNTEAVRNLMKGGAPFATDWLGTTSLHAAAAGGHLETCGLLLRSGILKDARTKVEKTPLHMACQEGHTEVALLLLANGADVNACDMLQMTPLHWAVEKEKPATVRVLLQNGADPTLVNKFDKTCFDIANDSDRQDIVHMLQSEPRRGEFTVVEKKKVDLRLTPQGRKLVISNTGSKPAIELVNVGGAKNTDRPKTAIVLPTYQNKKGVTVTKKPVNEEEQSRLAALQLLEEHGIEMLEGEDINLVASAVDNGQTVVLTEAGKQALSLTGEKLLPSNKGQKRVTSDQHQLQAKYIRISTGALSESLSPPNKMSTPKRFIKENIFLADISKKFKEAKREAEQYKELYAKKQQEAEEYRSKLETITMARKSSSMKVEDAGEEEEDIDEDFDEEEEDDEEGE